MMASASDDQMIYSGRFDNGWGDSWSWMPRHTTNNPFYTNNPVFVSSNSMALVPGGNYQVWWLKAGTTVDTKIYTNLTFWLYGSTGGQTIGVTGGLGGSDSGLPTITVTAPANTWQQFTISLGSLGVKIKANLTGFQFGNATTTVSMNMTVPERGDLRAMTPFC